MTKSAKFICMLFAGAVAMPLMASAQEQQANVARIQVGHHIPLTTACPGAISVLPEKLYPAWREIDTTADVLVDFKLDGDQVTDVKASGGYGNYYGLVRSAVKSLRCQRPGEGAYAVRFRIQFRYPEDEGASLTAMTFSDEPPALAAR